MTLDAVAGPADSLILVGGRVIDPANQIDEIADVVVGDGRILEVGPDLRRRPPGSPRWSTSPAWWSPPG